MNKLFISENEKKYMVEDFINFLDNFSIVALKWCSNKMNVNSGLSRFRSDKIVSCAAFIFLEPLYERLLSRKPLVGDTGWKTWAFTVLSRSLDR